MVITFDAIFVLYGSRKSLDVGISNECLHIPYTLYTQLSGANMNSVIITSAQQPSLKHIASIQVQLIQYQ